MRLRFIARRQSGHSLLEMLFATTLLTFVAGGSAALLMTGAGLFEETNSISDLDQKTTRAMQKAVRLLVDSGVSTLQPSALTSDYGSSTVTFQVSTGVVDGAVVWGESQSLALEEDPLDPEDGVDNDGDGVIDEGRLVWTRDVGGAKQESVVLCRDVAGLLEGEVENDLDDNGNGVKDETGFCARLEGESLWIGLTRVTTNAREELVESTEVVMLRLRNQ